MRIERNKAPEINAGSMADIAFLLLIFFLVTTTMDAEKGINRKLPPWQPNVSTPPFIHTRNILRLMINSNDQIMIDDDYVEVEDIRQFVKAFVINNGDGTCSFCETGKQLNTSSDNPKKAIISLQNDRNTSYEVYVKAQNEIVAAYNELRDELAVKWFGLPFGNLKDPQQIYDIKKAIPQVISEAEPIDLGS